MVLRLSGRRGTCFVMNANRRGFRRLRRFCGLWERKVYTTNPKMLIVEEGIVKRRFGMAKSRK